MFKSCSNVKSPCEDSFDINVETSDASLLEQYTYTQQKEEKEEEAKVEEEEEAEVEEEVNITIFQNYS